MALIFTAHAGVRRRRRPNFSETPPPSHLATADKPDRADMGMNARIGIFKE